MKIEKYICDICRKDIGKEGLYKYYSVTTGYELCKNCLEKMQTIYDEYNKKCELAEKEFLNKIDKLKKENL